MAKAMKFERQFMGSSGDVLLANPNMATLPPSLHVSLPSWCVSTDRMSNFRSQEASKKSEMEQSEGRGRLCSEDKTSACEADDGLELRLGLSLGRYPGKSRESPDGTSVFGARTNNICALGEPVDKTVKIEAEEKLEKEFALPKHEPVAHFSRSTCESQQDGGLNKVHDPGIVHCWNEAVAKAEGGVKPTAAQVWHSLQNSRAAVSEMVVSSPVGEGASAFTEAATAVWAHMVRRSVSMQPMAASKDCEDAAPSCIRRSVSNGSSITPQQLLELPSASLARPISCIEPLQDKAPDLGNTGFSPQHQEALELQRKKELQAWRRQEARRRRRILIEEKQLKRIKKDESKVFSQARGSPTSTSQSKNSSAAVIRQEYFLSPVKESKGSVIRQDSFLSPVKESKGLQRIGSNPSLHAAASVHGRQNEHAGTGDQIEGTQKLPEIRRNTKQKREKCAGRNNKDRCSREAVKGAKVSRPRIQGIQTAMNRCESPFCQSVVEPDVRVQRPTRDAIKWKPAKVNSADEEEGGQGKDVMDQSRPPSSEPSLEPLQRMPSLSHSKDQAKIIGQGSKQSNDVSLGHPHAEFDTGKHFHCKEKNGCRSFASRLGVAQRHCNQPKTFQNQAHGVDTACSSVKLNGKKVVTAESGHNQVANLPVPEGGRNVKGAEQTGPDGAVAAVMEGSEQETSNLQQDRAGQKFVDKGYLTELPLVSTIGSGPNGKKITGAMYILNRNQVRIVCTCHGQHLSPSEFVQHAGSTDLSNPERNIVVNPFPFLGQMSSAPH